MEYLYVFSVPGSVSGDMVVMRVWLADGCSAGCSVDNDHCESYLEHEVNYEIAASTKL